MNPYSTSRDIAGLKVVESANAVALVERPKPLTLDMQILVDCVGVKLEYKPCALKTSDGLIVHPAIASAIRQHMRAQMDRAASSIFFGG